ncbi:MAG: hypothetical protein HQL03_09330, partial [Nitrospirae bacterium]|nr:hypothetical protein [Nitrospirota bacterium]
MGVKDRLGNKALCLLFIAACQLFTMVLLLPFAYGYALGEPPVFPGNLSPFGLTEESVSQAQSLSVNPQNRDESTNFYNTYYVVNEPAISWNGNHQSCNAGTTAQDFRDAIAQRINYFRAMAGVPAIITFSDTYSAKAQEAALMVAPQTTVVMQPPPLFGFVGTWVVVLVVEDQPIPLEVASFLT